MELFSGRLHQRKVDSGQATLEFALLLPLFALCLCAITAATTISLTSLRLTDIVRSAARAASTSDNPHLAVESVVHGKGIVHNETIDPTQEFLTVHLSQQVRLPLIGVPLPAFTLTAQSTVLIEGLPTLHQ